MIKDIVVKLTVGEERDAAAHYAISLASLFKAHLVGIAFVDNPSISPNLIAGIPVELIDAQHKAGKALAKAAATRFEGAAKQAGVMTESRILDIAPGAAGDRFAHLARGFDLSVLRKAEPDETAQESIIEAALFESGRPVIVVPISHKRAAKFDRVMVNWDGSRAATRALGDAIPLLKGAKTVEVVTVAASATKNAENPEIDIGQHLSRHGLNVGVKRIIVGDIDITSAILNQAADTSADLMVMGGYGHSRLREYILGGVTRGILLAMTLPTLMSN